MNTNSFGVIAPPQGSEWGCRVNCTRLGEATAVLDAVARNLEHKKVRIGYLYIYLNIMRTTLERWSLNKTP